ncbi:MAG: hypothetical protein AAGE94_11920 [Acidobacteriota bacterium]
MTVDADAATRRQRLVERLRARGVLRTASIEAAFGAVGRHHFLPDRPLAEVYRDVHLVAKEADGWRLVTSTGPWLMATMLEQLQPRPGQRLLEIGAGTGYNAAMLSHLVGVDGAVTSLDIDDDAVRWARRGLDRAAEHGLLGAPVTVRSADGFAGDPEGAPWDGILVTVRTDKIAPAWVEHLAPGGRLVVPLALGGVRHGQLSIAFEAAEDHLRSLSVRDCGFVRPRGAMGLDDHELLLTDRPRLSWGDAGRHPISGAELFGLLGRIGPTLDSGVVVEQREMTEDFQTWLVAHDPDTCSVRAEQHWADWPAIVPLVEIPGRFRGSGGLFDGVGIALLGLRRDGDDRRRCEVVVRCHGPDDAAARLADRLLALLQVWDRAGRPRRADMQLRLDRPGRGVPVSPTGVRTTHAWGDLSIEWPSSAVDV